MAAIVPPAIFAKPAQEAPPLPAARRRGMLKGMAKALAKLVSMLTPKRR